MEYVSNQVFEEVIKRMEDEHHRMNNRLKDLEGSTKENTKLLMSVERLATNMESMQKEMKAQGKCLEEHRDEIEELKSKDGKMWRQTIGYLIAGVIGAVITFIFSLLGM